MRLRVALLLLVVALLGCSKNTETVVPTIPTTSAHAEYLADATRADPLDPIAVIETAKGKIALELYEAKAPKTTKNFIALAEDGFYNGLRFHLVDPEFAVQAGDPTGIGTGGADVPGVPLEIHPDLQHASAGIVGMARLESDPNSATSQFYITLEANPSLDGKYAVFGEVIKGMDVVKSLVRGDKITKIEIVRNGN